MPLGMFTLGLLGMFTLGLLIYRAPDPMDMSSHMALGTFTVGPLGMFTLGPPLQPGPRPEVVNYASRLEYQPRITLVSTVSAGGPGASAVNRGYTGRKQRAEHREPLCSVGWKVDQVVHSLREGTLPLEASVARAQLLYS